MERRANNSSPLAKWSNAGKVIEIFGVERDINNQRKYVQTSYDPTLTVALNAGNYVAVVEYADGRKAEKEFTIAAGKRAEVEVGR